MYLFNEVIGKNTIKVLLIARSSAHLIKLLTLKWSRIYNCCSGITWSVEWLSLYPALSIDFVTLILRKNHLLNYWATTAWQVRSGYWPFTKYTIQNRYCIFFPWFTESYFSVRTKDAYLFCKWHVKTWLSCCFVSKSSNDKQQKGIGKKTTTTTTKQQQLHSNGQ